VEGAAARRQASPRRATQPPTPSMRHMTATSGDPSVRPTSDTSARSQRSHPTTSMTTAERAELGESGAALVQRSARTSFSPPRQPLASASRLLLPYLSLGRVRQARSLRSLGYNLFGLAAATEHPAIDGPPVDAVAGNRAGPRSPWWASPWSGRPGSTARSCPGCRGPGPPRSSSPRCRA
jgi:hypothetical protein